MAEIPANEYRTVYAREQDALLRAFGAAKDALIKIAEADYRGNPSPDRVTARAALTEISYLMGSGPSDGETHRSDAYIVARADRPAEVLTSYLAVHLERENFRVTGDGERELSVRAGNHNLVLRCELVASPAPLSEPERLALGVLFFMGAAQKSVSGEEARSMIGSLGVDLAVVRQKGYLRLHADGWQLTEAGAKAWRADG